MYHSCNTLLFHLLHLTGVTCSQLPPLGLNLKMDGSSMTFQSIMKFSCTEGYVLMGGSRESICGGDGDWNATVPTCKGTLSTSIFYGNTVISTLQTQTV